MEECIFEYSGDNWSSLCPFSSSASGQENPDKIFHGELQEQNVKINDWS